MYSVDRPICERVYDAARVNPNYCDARDACCAGDPNCVSLPRREETP
jgi:hypothetical protein